jgi:hypothetical protein
MKLLSLLDKEEHRSRDSDPETCIAFLAKRYQARARELHAHLSLPSVLIHMIKDYDGRFQGRCISTWPVPSDTFHYLVRPQNIVFHQCDPSQPSLVFDFLQRKLWEERFDKAVADPDPAFRRAARDSLDQLLSKEKQCFLGLENTHFDYSYRPDEHSCLSYVKGFISRFFTDKRGTIAFDHCLSIIDNTLIVQATRQEVYLLDLDRDVDQRYQKVKVEQGHASFYRVIHQNQEHLLVLTQSMTHSSVTVRLYE